tara:strand:+ start:3531 stop:3878 length:348 start_codon:yes stop_codon:yes gene_type:complete
MLVSCKKGCILNGGVTTAEVNLDTDSVVCTFCDDELDHVSDFAKKSMIACGFVKRNRITESFTFYCAKCDKNVKTINSEFGIKGVDCEYDCSIDITKEMANAVSIYSKKEFDEDL